MKAVAFDRFGGPEVLAIRTVPVPECGPDEVLVRVDAAGVGVWDPWEREGQMAEVLGYEPHFPYVPGSDGAGQVIEIGKNASRFKPGDRVYGYALGNPKGGFYAEYIVVSERSLARIPEGMSVEEAGALAADGITGLQGLEDHLRVRAGQRLLIFGASGGIGHMAIQLANRFGARVLAAASGRDGVELARRLGADVAVEGHDPEAVEAAIRSYAPSGLDAALVLACDDVCQRAVMHVRQGGRIAAPNGVEPQPRGKAGVAVVTYDGQPSDRALQRLNELIEAGPFHVKIGHLYALEEAARAQQDVLRHHLGKLALKIH